MPLTEPAIAAKAPVAAKSEVNENTGPIRNKTTYVPISETEFTSVSDLIRGRVKLAEVNSVRCLVI